MCQHSCLFIKSALNRLLFIMGIGYPYMRIIWLPCGLFFLSKRLLSLGNWNLGSIAKGKKQETNPNAVYYVYLKIIVYRAKIKVHKASSAVQSLVKLPCTCMHTFA